MNRLSRRENVIVTKKEIVKKISEDIGLTQLKTKDIVQRTLDAIIHTLVSEGESNCETSVFRGQATGASEGEEPANRGQGFRAFEERGHV